MIVAFALFVVSKTMTDEKAEYAGKKIQGEYYTLLTGFIFGVRLANIRKVNLIVTKPLL